MSSLRLFLFGAPRLELNDTPLALRRSKALALLAYLAVRAKPQQRDVLLALLWPEFDVASARNNLRRELSLLKTALGRDVLVADRMHIALDPAAQLWLDVAAFRSQVAAAQQHTHAPGALCTSCAGALAAATQLYGDDFMAGFSLAESPAFDEWQFFEREALREQLATTLETLIAWHASGGRYDEALGYARRWLQLDPLHEPVHRELMRLYAWDDRPSAALRQYDEVTRLLESELGAEPDTATTELATAIRARQVIPPRGVGSSGPAEASTSLPDLPEPLPAAALAQPPIRKLPRTTGFVGRRGEVADIIRRLTDPDCRLLTLTGPGGIGKTQLALEVAHTIAEGWAGDEEIADGVLFVPLAAVSTPGGIISALADAAGFPFSSTAPPERQIVDYFHTKRMLIVLDNFEHLRAGAESVGELLAAAPGVRLLVTSREALNLVEEWFHPVDGLSFPGEDVAVGDVGQLARFDAVQLFEQRARRLRSDFNLAQERERVVRLCRLVEGMPLALELAASWLKVLPIDHVVSALERGLDILTTRDRSTPERHKNMREVLASSWRLLPVQEQAALARLAVFRGGCSAHAAEAVAGATHTLLAGLIDASLLRGGSAGRFQLHELVRQFAAEKLGADAEVLGATQALHAAYYLEFLLGRAHRLERGDRHAAVAEIAAEAENVRAALVWAIDHGDVEHIDRVLASCFDYYEAHGSYMEGAELFDAIVAMTDRLDAESAASTARLRARALIRRGAFRAMLGAYAAAVDDLERGSSAAHEHELVLDVAYAHLMLGMVERWGGDMAAAGQRCQSALEIATANGNDLLVAQALHGLAFSAIYRGEYGEGERLARQSLLAAAERVELRAQALHLVAMAAVWDGEYQIAETTWRESLALFESLGDRSGIATASAGVGWAVRCAGGRLDEASAFSERALGIARDLGRRMQITYYLGNLALIALARDDNAQAEAYGREGLAIARALNSPIYISYHLCNLGQVATQRHEFDTARRLLSEALSSVLERRLWTNVSRVLFQVALLFEHEAAAGGADEPNLARRVRAVELVTAITHWPATWHEYKVRAGHLLEQLRRELPDTSGAAAVARDGQIDWQAMGDAVLDELARPAVPG